MVLSKNKIGLKMNYFNIIGLWPTCEILKNLDPREICNYARLNKFFHTAVKNETLWKLVGARLGISDATKDKVKKHLPFLEIKKIISNFESSQIPWDIQHTLLSNDPPSRERMDHLKAYCWARDTLVVWASLMKQMKFRINPQSESSTYVIDWAKRFSEWFNKNSIDLSVECLDLKNLGLTSIPSDIGKLKGLEYLDLSNNQLRSIPDEIKKRKDITINLSGNPIELAVPVAL